jgi:transposase
VFMLLCHRLEDMVWVDETATYMEMAPTHGRSPRGVRVRFKTRKKHRRHTLICACNLDGVVASMLITGGMKTHHWREFCAKHLAPKLSSRHLVQWDNLELHSDEEAYKSIYETGARIFFQPPYSPESNPIEEAFSLLKTHLRQARAKTLPALREAVAQGLGKLNRKYMDAYVDNALMNILNW